MSTSTFLQGVTITATLLLAGRTEVHAQSMVPSLRIEPSVRLRRASERPLEHEGAAVSNGDTLLELAARWRLRHASMFVVVEGSTVPEWFDPQLVGSSYIRGIPISPQQLFAPAGARKLSIGLERSF